MSVAAPLRVLVGGAGIGGLSVANAISAKVAETPNMKREVDIQVFERADELRSEVGGAIGLAAALRLYNRIGVLPKLEPHLYSIDRFIVKDHRNEFLVNIPLEELAPDLAESGWLSTVRRHSLLETLYNCFPEAKERVHLDHEIINVSQTESGVTLEFANGKTAEGDVYIACDGIKSLTRQLQLRDPTPPVFSGHATVGGLCSVAGLEDKLPLSREFVQYVSRNGAYAIHLPTVNNQMNWGVIESTTTQHSEDWGTSTTSKEYIHDVIKTWNDPLLHELVDRTENITHRGLFDRRIKSTMPWVTGRIALLGDAAHSMLPYMGNGGNTAILDGAVMARRLVQHCNDDVSLDSITTALKEYQNERLAPAKRNVDMSAMVGKMLLVKNPLLAMARDFMYPRMFATSQFSKQFQKEQADAATLFDEPNK